MKNVNRGKRLRMMPAEQYREKLRASLVKHVEKSSEKGCWIWTGTKNRGGYGGTKVWGKTTNSHRASYYAFKGDIPANMYVCHSCDTPSCINPDHLFLGTAADNMRDASAKGRRPSGSGDKRSISVKIGEVVYGSIREAARMLNVGHGSIIYMIKINKATKIGGGSWHH